MFSEKMRGYITEVSDTEVLTGWAGQNMKRTW